MSLKSTSLCCQVKPQSGVIIEIIKLPVSARSPVFRTMMSTLDSKITTLKLEKIPKHIFKLFLGFLYTAQMEKPTLVESLELLKVSFKYEVGSLKSLCEKWIMESLKETDPVNHVFQVAHACNCSSEFRKATYNVMRR